MDGLKALVIDDEVDIANLFSMVLSLVGYQCEISNFARDALARLATSEPDLVLLDMRLDTELGGEDILYQIRANPRLKDTRVIIVTGHPNLATSIASLVDDVLIKPIDVAQLKQVIANLKSRDTRSRGDDFRDPVTGLYREQFFYSRVDLAIERARRRPDFIFAICVFDVHLFQGGKEITDPVIFNSIIREAAQSLAHNLRPTDLMARLAYAKFCTLHEELKKPEDARVIVNRLKTILTPPFHFREADYVLAFRIGTATNQQKFQTSADLLRLAEEQLI